MNLMVFSVTINFLFNVVTFQLNKPSSTFSKFCIATLQKKYKLLISSKQAMPSLIDTNLHPPSHFLLGNRKSRREPDLENRVGQATIGNAIVVIFQSFFIFLLYNYFIHTCACSDKICMSPDIISVLMVTYYFYLNETLIHLNINKERQVYHSRAQHV